MQQWTGCIAGALTREEFERELDAAGFEEVEIRETHRVHEHAASAIIRARRGDDHRRDPAQRSADALPALGGLAVEPVRDRPRPRPRAVGAPMDAADRELVYWVLVVADGRRGADHDEVLRARRLPTAARRRRRSSRPSRSTRRATCSSTRASSDEVVAEPAAIAAHVERAREQVSPAFRTIFDEALVEAHERLVAAPDDLAAKVRFVTIYHLILEGTLGLTSFRFITAVPRARGPAARVRRGLLEDPPRRDPPHRLRRLVPARGGSRRRRGRRRRSARRSRELLPSVAESLTPPDRDADTDWDALGASSDEIREFALGGLTRRLEHHRRAAREPLGLTSAVRSSRRAASTSRSRSPPGPRRCAGRSTRESPRATRRTPAPRRSGLRPRCSRARASRARAARRC